MDKASNTFSVCALLGHASTGIWEETSKSKTEESFIAAYLTITSFLGEGGYPCPKRSVGMSRIAVRIYSGLAFPGWGSPLWTVVFSPSFFAYLKNDWDGAIFFGKNMGPNGTPHLIPCKATQRMRLRRLNLVENLGLNLIYSILSLFLQTVESSIPVETPSPGKKFPHLLVTWNI